MFKKKPNIKAFAPIRSSDRRKFADQIIKDFAVEVPATSEEQPATEGQVPDAPTLSSIRNGLLPENTLSARFTAITGADAKQVSGTVYAGSHSGDDQRILWFKIGEKFLPTVYTLWENPRLVPLLHTPQFVLDKLRRGSPLMTPGLAHGPPFPSKAIKGAVVAVASIERPTVPRVVGLAEIDIASLSAVQGLKGHAVRSEHWDGDELWSWSSSNIPGLEPPESLSAFAEEKGDDHLYVKAAQMAIDGDDDLAVGRVTLQVEPELQDVSAERNEFVEGENPEVVKETEEEELSVKEIDESFWRAFIYAVYDAKDKNKGEKNFGIKFPVNQSHFMSNMVIPYLPAYTTKRATSLQIKRTSWKNAKKFIKALDKAKVLKSKDRDGGECVVLDIDFEDPSITGFVPYTLPKKDVASGRGHTENGAPGESTGGASGDPAIGQHLNKLNLLRPKDSLSPLFQAAGASINSLYLPAELRPILTNYIESEKLISSTNKRLVNLDPVLANAVFDGNSSLDREVIAKGSVPRDALVDRVQQACAPFWVLLRNDEHRENVKAKSGRGPKIQITLETRSGNKTVTKASGMEVFHISPQLLADELQKTCASSTSVTQLAGSSPKNPVMEVLVQGPQKDAISKALEKRGVSRTWIEVLDKTKGKKKS